MDKFDKVWTVGWTVVGVAVLVLVYLFGKRILSFIFKATKGDLGLPDHGSVNLSLFSQEFKDRLLAKDATWAEHAKFQSRQMGQIDDQLYAPCNWEGKPFRPEGEERCYNIELVGHNVSVYDLEHVHETMTTHPQDTVLDIMQKFELSPQKVLVYNAMELDDLDKTLLEYGIPDNRKVELLVREKQVALEEENVEELFQNL